MPLPYLSSSENLSTQEQCAHKVQSCAKHCGCRQDTNATYKHAVLCFYCHKTHGGWFVYISARVSPRVKNAPLPAILAAPKPVLIPCLVCFIASMRHGCLMRHGDGYRLAPTTPDEVYFVIYFVTNVESCKCGRLFNCSSQSSWCPIR